MGVAVLMVHDYLSRRIRKTASENETNTSDTSSIYDGYMQTAVIETHTGTNNITTFWDPTEQTATRSLAMHQNGEMFFYVHDLTKNITALVDASNVMFEAYDYKYRNYDPLDGRWMNWDPLGEEFFCSLV